MIMIINMVCGQYKFPWISLAQSLSAITIDKSSKHIQSSHRSNECKFLLVG